MTFTFRVVGVEPASDGETVLVGYVESGEITGPSQITIPTPGGPFKTVTTGIEVEGQMGAPARVGPGRKVFLTIEGQPPPNLALPCVAVGAARA